MEEWWRGRCVDDLVIELLFSLEEVEGIIGLVEDELSTTSALKLGFLTFYRLVHCGGVLPTQLSSNTQCL